MKKQIWIGFLAAALGLIAFAACSDSDSKKVADEVANALMDDLQFDNGTTKEGAPPPESPDGPPVTRVEGPAALSLNQPIDILLTTPTSFAETVVGAVVHAESAKKYIQVDQGVETDGAEGEAVMRLTARLTSNDLIPGDTYPLRLAMLDAEGRAGNYMEWNVTTPRNVKDCESACQILNERGCVPTENIGNCLSDCAETNTSQACFACLDQEDCDAFFTCIETACYSTAS